jgi:hypothetical protein
MRLATVALVTVLFAGCSGSHASATSNGGGSSTATTASLSRRIAWKPLLTLHQLGLFRTGCIGKRFATSFTAEVATEVVRVAGVPQERPHTLQPGQTRFSPLVRTRLVVWRISQATEPQTIKAVVSIRSSRCPYGIPTTHVSYGTASFNSR